MDGVKAPGLSEQQGSAQEPRPVLAGVRACVWVCVTPTLLSGPVEHLDVLELDADASPELHSVCGVVFVASLNGAVCVSPEQKATKAKQSLHSETERELT